MINQLAEKSHIFGVTSNEIMALPLATPGKRYYGTASGFDAVVWYGVRRNR